MWRAPVAGTGRTMRVLIVDDEPPMRSLVSKVLSRVGAACEMAGSAEEALVRLAREPFDIAMLDLALPGMDGLTLARTIAERYPDVPLVMITGSARFATAVSAMQAGAVDYVVKPFDPATLTGAFQRAAAYRRIRIQAACAHGLQQAIAERTLEIHLLLARAGESADSLVQGFMSALAVRSRALASHVERVGELSRRIGAALTLPPGELAVVHRTALLHDVGKLVLPASLLERTEALTEEEIGIVRRHPELGYQVISQVPVLADCADGILAQLERHDGTGWPQGLRGAAIPQAGRIVAVANAYDVMTHPRPHGPLRSPDEALEELDACSGSQFDPSVVRALFAVCEFRPAETDWDAAPGA